MSTEATVSVIIPTFNRARLVGRAIGSALTQTRPADEVIVVDDGSSDGTAEFIQREFPDVRYVWQENRGVSAARNRGIEEATSDWLAFLDSDDEWRAHKLERQLSALEESPDCRVCHTDEFWIRNGKRVNPRRKHAKRGGRIFEHCLPLCAISPSSVLIHRDVLDSVGLFDETLPACEDYDLWLRVCARWPVLLVPEPLVVKYGGHDDQLSRRVWGLDRFRIIALEKILAAQVLSRKDRQAAVRVLLEKIAVYTAGARKRGKRDEVAHYLEKGALWRQKTMA